MRREEKQRREEGDDDDVEGGEVDGMVKDQRGDFETIELERERRG